MSLLQGDTLTKSIAKNILRQRIYSVALDYFCNDRTFPTQSCNTNLEDIQTLLKFWAMMYSDRKYIKSNLVTDHDLHHAGGPTSLPHTELTTSGSYFETSSTIFNQDSRSISTEFRAPSTSGWMSGKSYLINK